MIVDDDESIREVVDVFLTGEGFEVVTADNGAIALEVARESHPDIILLDGFMPVMSGRDFLVAYKVLPEPRASVVLLTAASDSTDSFDLIPADGYLAKPFSLQDLLEVVERRLGPALGD